MTDREHTPSVSSLISKFSTGGDSVSRCSASAGHNEITSKRSSVFVDGLSKQQKPVKPAFDAVTKRSSTLQIDVTFANQSQSERCDVGANSSIVASKLNGNDIRTVAQTARKQVIANATIRSTDSDSVSKATLDNNNRHAEVVSVNGKNYRRLKEPSTVIANGKAPRKPLRKPTHVDLTLYANRQHELDSSKESKDVEAEDLYDDVINLTKPTVGPAAVDDDSDDLYDAIANYSH